MELFGQCGIFPLDYGTVRTVRYFLVFILFPPPIKLTAMHDITEILLKVALNTINQPSVIKVLLIKS